LDTNQQNIELMEISEVKAAGRNVRTSFDDEKLKELADSIRERGVLHPIVCRRIGNRLELIAGERRLRAARMLGLRKIPAIIREADDADVEFDRIVENLQREDLSDDDQYRALKALRDRGLTVARISKMTGLSTTSIQRVLALEDLKPSIRKRDDVSTYAKAFIARAPDHVQDLLAERVAEGTITSKMLGHDVMPAISETIEERTFSESEKRKVVEKIVRGASVDRPARAIVRQERGLKKLEREGIDVQAVSNQTLSEMIDLSEKYLHKLEVIQFARLDHLDPGRAIALINLLRQIHGVLGDMLQGDNASRRGR
jgi:ParB family chromosome partitioning protein